MDRFERGGPVTLRESTASTVGRVIAVSPDGLTVAVRWSRRDGDEDQVTAEESRALRTLRDSDDGML
jgi:hypothetical protein